MIEASIEAARQARAKGVTVVMDAGTMREGSKGLVALVMAPICPNVCG